MNTAEPLYRKIAGGLLIAFEGIDGSGKTTMAQLTARALTDAGYKAVYLREPTDGPHGQQLRQIMVSPEKRNPQVELELFLLDRRDDVRNNIEPVLRAGGIVCIDRYYISSMAYQGALGLDQDMIRRENEEFAPVPHLILQFFLPIDTALQRINISRADGANQFEKREYLQRVVAEFNAMDFPQTVKIDADATQAEVFERTWNTVFTFVNSRA